MSGWCGPDMAHAASKNAKPLKIIARDIMMLTIFVATAPCRLLVQYIPRIEAA